MEPLYVAQPGGMRLFKTIFGVIGAITVVGSVVLLVSFDAASGLITLASMLVLLLFVWLILPKRYEVWPDRLRIVFPAWGWDIPYDGIESVRAGRWYEAYGFAGVRFATAPGQSVTIMRHNANLFTHPNLVISPADREQFLRQLERAMRQ